MWWLDRMVPVPWRVSDSICVIDCGCIFLCPRCGQLSIGAHNDRYTLGQVLGSRVVQAWRESSINPSR